MRRQPVYACVIYNMSMICGVVKDRYGDQADETGSDSSESSSDDCEGVSLHYHSCWVVGVMTLGPV